jgi:hypothetical protein
VHRLLRDLTERLLLGLAAIARWRRRRLVRPRMIARCAGAMSQIFISHSSKNNPAAISLHKWLGKNGWDEVFLDIDSKDGISPGEHWEKALQDAADRCEAVLFLVSPAWLASQWCLDEFRLTRHLKKKPFGVVIEQVPLKKIPPEMTREWQLCDLAAKGKKTSFSVPYKGRTHKIVFGTDGLARLKLGLEKAGLSATRFAFNQDRSPYPGLRPLEEDDAAIFFGRDAQIITALDKLRGLREGGQEQLFVVLGAFGHRQIVIPKGRTSGPACARRANYLRLAVIRPETAVLSGENGLISSLASAFKALKLQKSRGDIGRIIETCGGFVSLLEELRRASHKRTATADPSALLPAIVIPIDQAEELFSPDGAGEAKAFLKLLTALKSMRGGSVAIATIRSDQYELLQKNDDIMEIAQQPFSLAPVPATMYSDIVEGPARRRSAGGLRLEIDPKLKDKLLADIAGEGDALPLLAFTLHRLFREYGEDGKLELHEYESLGGIKAAIGKAVETALRAADHPPIIPADPKAQDEGLRRTFIPRLVRLDSVDGTPFRQVTDEATMPDEARAFVERLVRASILTRDKRKGTTVIEIAHEVLLRQWDALRTWLADSGEALKIRDGIRRAAAE